MSSCRLGYGIEKEEPAQFVFLRLAQEYRLDPNIPEETQMLERAATEIMSGKRYVRLTYKEVIADKPLWKAFSPLDVLFPPRTESVENADFVAIAHRMTRDDILRMASDGFFFEDVAREVVEKISRTVYGEQAGFSDISGRQHALSQALDKIEGLTDPVSDHIPSTPILEIYTKIDIDGDGLTERVVLWYHKPSKLVLSIFEYPYPFREWPIVAFEFEHTSNRPYSSRGIAEMLSVHQKTVNMMHNARLDAAQILLAPMFKVRSLGQQFMRNIKFRPGARIPVQNPADLEPIQMDMRPLVEFLREEQFTKTLGEQYVGVFDPSLTQVGGGGRERRTATEVDAVVAQSTSVQSQDAMLFQLGMAKVHKQLWDLWEEFGPEEIYFRVTGEQQPKLAIKADLAGEYDITPAGSPTSTNQALILNRAREMIQLFMPDQSFTVKKEELVKEYFQAHDFQLAQRMVREPEEIQILQQAAAVMERAAQNVGVPA